MKRSPLRNLFTLALLAPVAAGCATDDLEEVVDSTIQPQLSLNQLSLNQLSLNSLTSIPTSNRMMTNVPLRTESYSDAHAPAELRFQLRDEKTRAVMRYIVECALDNTQKLDFVDNYHGGAYSFRGALGLCPEWGKVGGSANSRCQELVSACLLARNNAFGRSVPLSLRGEEPQFALSPSVPTFNVKREPSSSSGLSDTIQSFIRCKTTRTGTKRNCGWQPSVVGRCTAGTTVTVGIGGKPWCTSFPWSGSIAWGLPLGSSSADSVVRICEGLRGCDDASVATPDEPYGTLLKQASSFCGQSKPVVTFPCPSSSFYSVMVGPEVSSAVGFSATPAASGGGTSGKLPASEMEVFPWREGAFFGNVFIPEALASNTNGVIVVDGDGITSGSGVRAWKQARPGVVHKSMFACTSHYWNEAEAVMKDRLCAGGSDLCAAAWVGSCREPSKYSTLSVDSTKIFVCQGENPLPSGDYQNCDTKSTVGLPMPKWRFPITTYLNDFCDIIKTPGIPSPCENAGPYVP
ncbi:MAG: hypothetical protein HY698_20805 [Deltaproteobacteria bacterium]|nr:hypothetical protein [Deltaproteobacteria bacterium]